MMKLIMGKLSLFIWLVMAMVATAQNNTPAPVLDMSGQPLRRGVEYYVRPAITDIGGAFALVERNGSCPKYVGHENPSANRLPVTFAPYEEGEDVVRETKNFKATFSAATTCGVSTTWKVGERDGESQKRLIEIGDGGRWGNYFLINRDQRFESNIYHFEYCPAELCPICRFECGNFETLDIEDGKKLLSLGIEGTPFPVEFERV